MAITLLAEREQPASLRAIASISACFSRRIGLFAGAVRGTVGVERCLGIRSLAIGFGRPR